MTLTRALQFLTFLEFNKNKSSSQVFNMCSFAYSIFSFVCSSKLHQATAMNESTSSVKAEEYSWLGEYAPAFFVDGSRISVISTPCQFFESLKAECRLARKRIVLSALYLGTGTLEQELVESIKENVNERSVEVSILLDYNRGSRGLENSRTMLLPLLENEGVSVSLYQSPKMRGLWKILPSRWNEIVGVQHMKIFLFDDNVLLSGANLSDTYFTNRQDRYLMIRDVPELANFLAKLVDVVNSFSFKLHKDNTTSFPSDFKPHPFEDSDDVAFCAEAQSRIRSLLCEGAKDSENVGDTVIYPLLQASQIGIHCDEQATSRLLAERSPQTQVSLATGYFNLTPDYSNIILNISKGNMDILMASPEANGFYNAAGFSGNIPHMYTDLASRFYQNVHSSERASQISLCEYKRDGWSFHGKGLWLSDSTDSLPKVVFIGSPNFGYRSVFRDLELQAAIVTSNKQLQQQFQQERTNLHAYSHAVSSESLSQNGVPTWVSMISPIVKTFF